MASERKWPRVVETFAVDGTSDGAIKVASTDGFKVKARVIIKSNTQAQLVAEIKSIPDDYTIYVGPPDSKEMEARIDVSAFTVADGATIDQPAAKRPGISSGDFSRAVYEEEPTVAIRVIPVDKTGDLTNPSIDGIIPKEFDDSIWTRNIDKFVTQVDYYLRGQFLWSVEITRDIDEDITRVRRINP